MILVCSIRQLSVPLRSLTTPLSFVSYAAFRFFFLSHIYSFRVRKWLALENAPPNFTTRTSSVLLRWDINYFSCAYITGLRHPSTGFLVGIVIRDPTMGERVFVFPKKRRGKKVYQIIFSTPANTSSVSQVTC